MKAAEVLKRYRAGKKNFRGLNLRGQSFKGKNVSGADFSECDIRSTDFSNANLCEAKLSGAKAGLQRRWAIRLIIALWLASGIGGFLLVFVSYVVVLAPDTSDVKNFNIGISGLIILMTFFSITIKRGLAWL